MSMLPHLAARLYGVPLAIHRPKLDVILSVLGSRIGLSDAPLPDYTPPERPEHSGATGIAVIPIYGTLVRRTSGMEALSGLTSYAQIADELDAALADPDVSAILLDIDSPGGESSGVFDLADRIRAASQIKPVWAVANDMAFSAAYALASAASKVFVSRTGGVGSIGVIAMHVDQSAKDMKDGIRYTAVFAGERKNDLSPHAPISDEAQSFLAGEVNRIYDLFVDFVASNRQMSANSVRATEAGLFFGQAGVDAGLADAVGTFDDALAQLTQFLSPNPTPLASASRAGILCNHPKESLMTTEVPTAVPVDGQPAPNSAVEIAQLCALAGRADLTVGFLSEGITPEQARARLLVAKAESVEIASRISPDASPVANPVIEAAKRLAAR